MVADSSLILCYLREYTGLLLAILSLFLVTADLEDLGRA